MSKSLSNSLPWNFAIFKNLRGTSFTNGPVSIAVLNAQSVNHESMGWRGMRKVAGQVKKMVWDMDSINRCTPSMLKRDELPTCVDKDYSTGNLVANGSSLSALEWRKLVVWCLEKKTLSGGFPFCATVELPRFVQVTLPADPEQWGIGCSYCQPPHLPTFIFPNHPKRCP